MSFGETILLGALAGFTIYLGLPLGRVEFVSKRVRVALAMFSVGVLAFLFAEVLVHGVEIVEEHFEKLADGEGSLVEGLWLALLFGGGFSVGSAGLALIERRMRMSKQPPIAGGASDAMTVEQAELVAGEDFGARAIALRTGMTIAAAIGLHNFAEGLAIGVSREHRRDRSRHRADHRLRGPQRHRGLRHRRPAGQRAPKLALARAGRPRSAAAPCSSERSSATTSPREPLELLFYSVSAGAILYVIGEIWGAMRKLGHRELGLLDARRGRLPRRRHRDGHRVRGRITPHLESVVRCAF